VNVLNIGDQAIGRSVRRSVCVCVCVRVRGGVSVHVLWDAISP